MGLKVMLTTVDNPYDPFTQFDAWYAWDTQAGYHTSSFLARILASSEEMSDADIELALEQAIDEIIQENVIGMFLKVTKENSD